MQPTSPRVLSTLNTNHKSSPSSSPNARKPATATAGRTALDTGVELVAPRPTPKGEQLGAMIPRHTSRDPEAVAAAAKTNEAHRRHLRQVSRQCGGGINNSSSRSSSSTNSKKKDEEKEGPSSDDSSTPTTALVVQKKASRRKNCHIAVLPCEVIARIAEWVPLFNKEDEDKDEMGVFATFANFVKGALPHPADRRAMTLVCSEWRQALIADDWPTERNRADEIGWSQKRHDKLQQLIHTGQVDLVDRLLQKGAYVDWGYHVVRFGSASDAAVLLRASGASGRMSLVEPVVGYLQRRDSAISRLVEIQKHLSSGPGELLDEADFQKEEIVRIQRLGVIRLEHCAELVIQGALEGSPQKGRNTKCDGARRNLCLDLIPNLKNLEDPERALLDGKTPYGHRWSRTTLLHLAVSMKCCRQCAYEVTDALLKKGANASARDDNRRTPLHCAIIVNGSLVLVLVALIMAFRDGAIALGDKSRR